MHKYSLEADCMQNMRKCILFEMYPSMAEWKTKYMSIQLPFSGEKTSGHPDEVVVEIKIELSSPSQWMPTSDTLRSLRKTWIARVSIPVDTMCRMLWRNASERLGCASGRAMQVFAIDVSQMRHLLQTIPRSCWIAMSWKANGDYQSETWCSWI